MKQGLTGRPEELTEEVLNGYLKNFLDIADFKGIDNGKALLEIIKNHQEHGRVKTAVRKVVGLFNCDSPPARVCALQFLKEAVETGCFYAVEHMEKTILSQFVEIVQYRSSINNIQRGSTYFLKEMDKNMGDDELINLMKLSSTFFRMTHECLFVWGAIYFPGSLFDKARLKLERKITFPVFPKDFKFYSENKVNNFKANCQALIKKMQERVLMESTGNVTKRSLSEDKNMPNSPRKIKETRDAPKMQKADSKRSAKLIDKKETEAVDEKIQEDVMAVPPNSSKVKKHKPKKGSKQAKKEFIESKDQQKSQKTLQNSSVKLRKKNSFNEVPFSLLPKSPKAHDSQQNSSSSLKKEPASKQSPAKHNHTIIENEQSEGGRYSVDETVSKQSQEISEIMYDYNQRQSLSPRSQYSLTNQGGNAKFKKEISEQLPSSKTAKVEQQKIPVKQERIIIQKPPTNIAKPSTSKNKEKPAQPSKHQPPKQKQTFNLPLNQLKQKRQQQLNEIKEQNPSQTERSRQKKTKREMSARKKFVSSEEESMKEIAQPPKVLEKNLLESKLKEVDSYEFPSPSKEKKPQKIEIVSATKEQEARPATSPSRPKEPTIAPAAIATAAAPPPKASKPIKLKSNTNLKTVFESSDYKVLDYPSPKKQQQKLDQKSSPNSIRNQQKTQLIHEKKSIEKTSIYDAVEIDTIETIMEVPTVRQRNEPRIESQNVSADKTDSNNKSNAYKQPQLAMPKKPQAKQSIQSTPKIPHQSEEKGRSRTNTTLQQAKTIQQSEREQPRHFKAIRNDAIYSSRRFRNFKEVNLFIQPQNLPPKQVQPINRTDELRVTIDESFQSTIKEQILQEFNRLKSTILEESLNRTQPMRSDINTQRKESSEIKVECSTQTKLRHKSKGKFERKGKYMLLSESQHQQNTSDINLPKVPISKLQPNPISSSKQTLQRKTTLPIQQQLKPNTLLYALYKRRSLNSLQ